MGGAEQADQGAVPFAWGKKRGRGGKELNVQFYTSCTYDGVEYALYDSVYLYKEGEPEPFIGKLIKMWQQPGNRRRVKILWFFRPVEIRNFLGDHEKPLNNEIFLACGQGVGVSDVNPLESIAGKCNVVCTSKDPRNRQPSDEELKLADYIFHRTFDVGSFTISDEIGETVDGIKAEYIFNFDEESTHQRSGANGASKNPSPTVDISPEKIRSVEPEIGAQVENPGPLDAENDSSSKKIKLPDASGKRKRSVGTDLTEENISAMLEIASSSPKSGKSKSPLSTPDVSLRQEIEPEMGAEVAKSGPLDAPNKGPISKKMKLSDASGKQKKTHVIEEKMTMSKPESEFSTGLKSGKSKPALSTPGDSLQQEIESEIGAEMANSGLLDAPNDPSSQKMKPSDASRKQKIEPQICAKMILKPDGEFSTGLKSGKSKSPLSTPDVSLQQEIEPEICAEAAKSGPIDAPNDPSSKRMKLPDPSRKQKSSKGTDVTEETTISKPESEFSSLKSGKSKPTPDVSSQKRQNFDEIEQVPRRPGADTSKWFTGLPWETRIQEARERGTLLLIENFDPVHTSEEIEDLIYHFFKKQCTARVLEFSTFSSPFHGRALVICKSRGDVEEIVKRLKEKVLMLSNGRPLIARLMLNRRPPADSKTGKFYGHYVAEKTRGRPEREEMRNAVSTSHCSQPNTLEFEMAVDWMLLHEKSACWWRELHEEHDKEVKKLRALDPAKKRA